MVGVGRLQQSPDVAREVGLQATDRFAGALAFAAPALEVLARGLVAARTGHDHAVKGGVDLAVAALIEAMALRVARAGGDRRDAGDSRELGRCREALSAGDLTDERGRSQRPQAGLGEQLRRDLLDEDGDVALELIDRDGQLAQAAQHVARDLDAHRLLSASQAAADPRRPLL